MLRSAEGLSRPTFSRPSESPVQVAYLLPSGQPEEQYPTFGRVADEAERIVLDAEHESLKFDLASQIRRRQRVRSESPAQIAFMAHSGNIWAQREPKIIGRHRASEPTTTEEASPATTVFRGVATARHLEPPTSAFLRLGTLMEEAKIPPQDRTQILVSALTHPSLASDYARIMQTRVTRPI